MQSHSMDVSFLSVLVSLRAGKDSSENTGNDSWLEAMDTERVVGKVLKGKSDALIFDIWLARQ